MKLYNTFCIKCDKRTTHSLENDILTCQICQNKKKFPKKNNIQSKGITENLQEGMKDLNKALNQLPRLKIGKDNPNPQPMFNEKEQKIINKVKKVALIVVILGILGYAAYSIIRIFI